MRSSRRVVVTGLGMVTPLGGDLAETWGALEAGRSAVGPVTRFGADGFLCAEAAQIQDFSPRPYFRVAKALKLTDRRTNLAVAAASMAVEDAGFGEGELDREGCGVVVGSSGSDLQVEDLARALGEDSRERCLTDVPFFAQRILSGLNPLWLLINLPNMVSAHVAIQLGVHGPNSTVMTDWVAGSQAIGEAYCWIENGEADTVLAGGADNGVLPFVFGGYEKAGFFDSGGSLAGPFVPGEGAAMLVLESRDRAIARGARIYGEIRSYASASSPLEALGDGLSRTMERAISGAGLTIEEVAAVGCAGVFTPPHWNAERAALERLFGPSLPNVRLVEFKSRMGHTLAASGAIEVALALKSLQDPASAGPVLCNSLGLVGQAVTLAVGREQDWSRGPGSPPDSLPS